MKNRDFYNIKHISDENKFWFFITKKDLKKIKIGDQIRYHVETCQTYIYVTIDDILLNNIHNFIKGLDVQIYRRLKLKEKIIKIKNKIKNISFTSKYINFVLTPKCYFIIPFIIFDYNNYICSIRIGWLNFYLLIIIKKFFITKY